MGFVCACLLAIVWGFIWLTIRNAEEAEEKLGLSVMGEIPHLKGMKQKENNVLIQDNLMFSYVEAWRGSASILQHHLQHHTEKYGCKTIAITSAMPDEGKTVSTCNMAIALSQMQKKVLLIDFDIHKKGVEKLISKQKEKGLLEIAYQGVPLQEVLQSLPNGVDVLYAGMNQNNESPLVSNLILQEIIKDLEQDYDYIFIDTPPVYIVADALEIVKSMDAVVMVIKQDFVTVKILQQTLALIEKSGGNVIGCIVNDIRNYNLGSGYGHKYKYYYAYPKQYNSKAQEGNSGA